MTNVEEAVKALTEKPVFSTEIERIRILDECKHNFDGQPQPMRFARTMDYAMRRLSTPLKSSDVILGRSVDRELSEEEEALYQAFLHDPANPYYSALNGSGHCSYDWEDLVSLGLGGLKKRAQDRKKGETDEEKLVFLTGAMGVYDSVSVFIERYAQAAEKAGMTEQAQNLNSVAHEPPKTFYAAMQLLWIVTLIDCYFITANPTLTLGRMDQFLLPLYRADVKAGRLDEQKAKEIITDYYCKHNLIMGRGEHQVGDATNSTTFGRIHNFDAPQYLLLAGTDKDGKNAVNELTYLFAECIEPKFKNPVVVVRYFEGMDKAEPGLWKILTGKALESASMMFYNDDDVIAAFKRMGLGEDSRNYIHFGCNWPSPGTNGEWINFGPKSWRFDPDMDEEEKKYLNRPFMRYYRCNLGSGYGGWAGVLDDVLFSLAEKDENTLTIDDFYDGFFEVWDGFLDEKLEYLEREVNARKSHPAHLLTFTDCMCREPISKAECLGACAKYHFELQSFYMFGTVVDCLTVIDELVFRRKAVSLKKLAEAVKNNFEGEERLRLMCKSVERYGSDSELSNYHAERLSKRALDSIYDKSKPYFERSRVFLVACMQSDTWHLKEGLAYGATPDGRKAGEAFSQNSRPCNGACTKGVTGMLNSMLSVDASALMSGALNLDVDARAFKGEEGRKNFAGMLAAYFNAGGLHAQVSCVSRDDLIAAQKNPDAYRDLRVRVTGYSGIFVDFCKDLQNDIINRLS